jgi:hypothetical protein
MDESSTHSSPARRRRNWDRRVRYRLKQDICLLVQCVTFSQVSIPSLKLVPVADRSLLNFDPFVDAGDSFDEGGASYGAAPENLDAPEHIAASALAAPAPGSPLMDFFELSLLGHPLGEVMADAVADVCALACSFTRDFILGFTRSLRGVSERASLLNCWASYYHGEGSCHCFESAFVDASMSHFQRD